MGFQKGYTPWNKGLHEFFGVRDFEKMKLTEFKRGMTPWNKGKKGLQKHTTEQNELYRKMFTVNNPMNDDKIRAKISGSNSPHWKGGITTPERAARMKFRNEMQKQVFERDNYTCQMCGKKGNLQVDHIQSWSEYVELRFSMDNCRTLCAECHYKITFGKPMPKETKGWGHNFIERRVLS